MTYREYSARLAQHLANLSVASGSRYLDDRGLDVALMGRHETVRLMQEAIATATGRATARPDEGWRFAERTTLRHAMNNPVEALQNTIDGYPTVRSHLALMEVRKEHLPSSTAARWYEATRAATIARHHLTSEAPAYANNHRWSLVADVAAMAPVVQDLDRQLLVAARRIHSDDSPTTQALVRSDESPMRLVAGEAAAVARAESLPDLAGLHTPPVSARPVEVASFGDLLEAQRRLPIQLQRAEEIRPNVIAGTALGQARILLTAAELLENGRHRRAADLAREMGTQIAQQVRPKQGDVTSPMPGDPTPLMQTQGMWEYIQRRRLDGAPLEGREAMLLRGAVHHAPTVVQQLSRTAEEHLTSSRWLISYSMESPFEWDLHRAFDEEPRLVTALVNLRETYPAAELSLLPRAELTSARSTLAHVTTQKKRDLRPASPDIAVAGEVTKSTRRAPRH
ncbi:hypothetical protein ATJ97_0107 [Georgenia soli]|uniref:Uncharacterized protein n=1 Tax=Georgenia soli TaxID=638953 RepID=A0A2A9F169_9MICO|nr:hypothetical protein [Georgenia soli]PFG45054.1 hypothetical protein ATJ97_0107 [Georgenia soli]